MQPNTNKKSNHVFGVVLLLLPYIFVFGAMTLFCIVGFEALVERYPLFALVVNTGEDFIKNDDDVISSPPSNDSSPDNINSGDTLPTIDPSSGIVDQIKDAEVFPSIKWGQLWASLYIDNYDYLDKNDKKINVYYGDDDKILGKRNSAGMSPASFFAGKGRTCIISGHVTNALYDLRYVNIGTKITLNTIYGVYTYKVTKSTQFHVNDYKDYFNKDYGKETLLIYTCYYPPGVNWDKTDLRHILVCEKISGKDWS